MPIGNSNTLTLAIEVDDKGTPKIRQFAGEVEKAGKQAASGGAQGAKSLDAMTASTDRLTASVSALKPQVGSATVLIGSLAAAAYSAYSLIPKVIESSRLGSMLDKQSASFANLASSAGASGERMLDDLKRTSGGMVAEASLVTAAGKAMLMSIPSADITRLMEIAAATARMTGQTVTAAFDDITMGVARQSKLILDNLGIIVDVDRAYQNYASTIGKTAAALTDAEQRQAFMNAVLQSGDDMIRRLGGASGSLDGVTRATAEWSDAMDALSVMIAKKSNPLFEAIAGVLRRINLELRAGRSAALEYNSSLESVEARIAELNKRHGDMANRRSWGYNEPQDVEYRELLARREALRTQGITDFGRGNVYGRYGGLAPAYSGSQRVSDNEVAYDVKTRWAAYEASLKRPDRAAGKTAGVWDKWGVRPYTESEAFLADQAAYDAWKKYWSDYKQRLPESQQSEAMLADQKAYEEWKAKTEKAFDGLAELSEHTAERMQDTWSDLFFDAFTLKLKSASDYAKSVFESIARSASNILGQQFNQALFGEAAAGKGGPWGGLVGAAVDWFKRPGASAGDGSAGWTYDVSSARGNVFGPAGLYAFAAGGVVTRPTVFAFGRGAGLMGEAGPEAIMPLKRNARGELGVSGGGTVINVHNYSGQPAESRETRGPGGERQIELMIGRALAKDGPASRAVLKLTGSSRRGIMRG